MYCKVTGGVAAEYTLRQFRQDNPLISLSADDTQARRDHLATLNIYPVIEAAQPVIDPATQKITGYTIEGSGTIWTQTWTVEAKTQQEQDEYTAEQEYQADVATMQGDNALKALLKARPDQINTYIDTNVTDLASAKDVLKILARAVSVLGNRVLR